MRTKKLIIIQKPKPRVAMANNTNICGSFNTSGNWVHNAWTTHTSGPRTYSNIEVTFLNGLISTNSESNSAYDFTLRCGILINGTFYQGQPVGVSGIDATVVKTWGTATFTFPGLKIPPNTTFYVTNRRVATDGGVAGSYNVITNTSGITQRQDGIIAGTDNTKDYTMGVGIAHGARNNRVTSGQVNGSHAVTGVTRATGGGGSGYSGGLNLGPWYGPAGAGAPGALIPGSGITGYGNTSGGLYTTTSITGGGSGHDSSNPPYIYIGGGSTAASGFGTTTATYGPSLITGIPDINTPSLLFHGDSIMSGYGSVDTTGDLNGNMGAYEQRFANAYGAFKIAVSGEQAVGWLSNNTKQLAFINSMVARGLKISHVIIGLGVNDFLTNTNSNVKTVTEANVTSIANIWRSYGAKIILTTIPPNCTSTDSFVTTGNQTEVNSNYTAASKVDQYNTDVNNGTVVGDYVIDIRSFCQDSVATTKWRVDTYGGGHAFCASDGTHPSIGVGIPYLVANMTIPTLH